MPGEPKRFMRPVIFNESVTFAVTPSTLTLTDDQLWTFGTTADIALLNRSTSLTANTALTGVLVGTPIVPAVAANSFILGNVTADGDILLAGQTGGNSHAVFFADLSAGTTSIMVAGVATARFDSTDVLFPDDYILSLGTGASAVYKSTSTTANTAVTSVILGTPITPALAADTLIIANQIADGDLLLAGQTGGNTHAVFFADLSAGTTSIMVAGVAVARFDSTDVLFPDDYILTIGTGASVAYKDDSTLANTAVTNVILGTPVVPALAADTLIVSNQIANGDVLIATQTGGNTQAAIWVDGSAGQTALYGAGTLGLVVSATANNFATNAVPQANDGAALGTTALGWADLHLAAGGVINWVNGEVTITETDANTLTIGGATVVSFGANTLNATGTRILQSYHTNITSTNAVTVDSSIRSKEDVRDFDRTATAILNQTRVVDYRHRAVLDPSQRRKLGIVAETLHEPLALTEIEDPDGGTYPGVNLMGLVALLVKQGQEQDARIAALEGR